MPYNALQLGSTTASSEAVQSSLKKINEMLAELYTSSPTLVDWENFYSSIIPNIDSTRDLGSPTRQWRSLYVSNNTIYIGGTSLSVTEDGSIQVGGNTFNPIVSYNDLTDKPTIPNLTGYATESFVSSAISNLVDTSPSTLDTLNELAAALGDDPNFATTITTALGNKADIFSLNISNWDTAYNWGDHSIAGYLQISDAATTYQPLDGDLTAIAGLTETTGLLRKNNSNTWSIDTNTYLTSDASINALVDVDTATVAPTTGQVLKWSGTAWTPAADAAGATTISGLTDVQISGEPNNGEMLIYNSSSKKWVPGSTSGSGGTSLGTRTAFQVTTASLTNLSADSVSITCYKGYAIYKIQTDAAAWVRIYSDSTSRTLDAGRNIDVDPINVSGLISEIVTTDATTVKLTPGVIGFNDDSPVSNVAYLTVSNLSGSTRTITVTVTLVQLEA
jgi:hypothetical protein